jgi:hypothetical protein
MLLTYGRGRAEQFRVHPTFGSILNFVPPMFCVYLASLPAAVWYLGSVACWPLMAYALLVLAEATALSVRRGPVVGLATAPLIFLSHVLYGIGLWRGLFGSLKHQRSSGPGPVTIERVAL